MAASGKKQKKLKGKTVELSVFLADEQRGLPGGPGSSIVRPRPTFNSWADEVESQDTEGDYPEVPYKSVIDRSMLPTAPRAARGPDIDWDTVPKQPPFTAYISNLPYDIEQEKIYKFFSKLKVQNIRLSGTGEKGRPRGTGYVDFEDRESLIEALSMNDDIIQGRKIRIALSGNSERDDGRRGGSDDQIDRTDCDWRRGGGERSNDGFGDRDGGRYSDRFGDRDRDRDRGGFGSAVPETGRWERMGPPNTSERNDRYVAAPDDNQKWDRGFTVDSSKGDRWSDHRGGDDRWGDRRGDDRWSGGGGGGGWNDRRDDRHGDRDRGYGDRDRDRGYGDRDRGYGNRDRHDDRGYGGSRKSYASDRNYERRGRNYGSDRNLNSSRDSSREPPRDRQKLKLQPRTKPVEVVPEKTSSIFGGARPVDTSQREKEIEERLRKQESVFKSQDEEKENLGTNRKVIDRPYRADGDRESSRRERRHSSNSNQSKGIKPAPLNQSRTRRDSNTSNTSEAYSDEKDEKVSPPSPLKEDTPAKMVPAPPPKENIWERRKTEQKSGKDNSYNEDKNSYESSDKWKKNQIDSNRENDRRSIENSDPKRVVKGGNEKGRFSKDKQMPKSYEEMPQYQDKVKKKMKIYLERKEFGTYTVINVIAGPGIPQGQDWTDANKFTYLNNEEEDEYQENLS